MKEFVKKITVKISLLQAFAKDNKKKAACVFCFLILFLSFFSYRILTSRGKSKLIFSIVNSSEINADGESVMALNRNAKFAKISGKRPSTAYFLFTDEQKKSIEQVFLKNGNGGFYFSVSVKKLSLKKIQGLQNSVNARKVGSGATSSKSDSFKPLNPAVRPDRKSVV